MCLCTQGESNTDTFQGTLAGPANYACRMRAAVQDWREKFKSPMLPFFNIELAACNDYPTAERNDMGPDSTGITVVSFSSWHDRVCHHD